MKKVITERDVIRAWQKRSTALIVSPNALVTPAAADAARVRGMEIVKEFSSQSAATAASGLNKNSRGIILGADHGGFELKEILKSLLIEIGYEVEDVGTHSADAVDYPDFAHAVAQKVVSAPGFRGVMIDGAGVGSAITANKIPGVRAAACYDVYTARNSRLHNNANLLTLGSRVVDTDTAKAILKAWLESDFEGGRHEKRVDKIAAIEKRYMKE
ncbi:MAG TPA: ribose 5-phosphate isomerase B [bacterium]